METKSNEGFWGHMNPFARKKWVQRQVNPVKDRLNELDQLNAKNANDIKDVDSRAQAGIHKAQSTADAATQQATEANAKAAQAQQTAEKAAGEETLLTTTVSNLDQYQPVTETEIHFKPGQTALNAQAKAALDDISIQLSGKQGYILEVQGYARSAGQAGIQSSQQMANAVVRYLVTEHQVPIYRIHQIAMGNAKYESATGTATKGSIVHVEPDAKQFSFDECAFEHTFDEHDAVGVLARPAHNYKKKGRLQPSSHTTREPRQIGPSLEGPFFCCLQVQITRAFWHAGGTWNAHFGK